MFKKINDKVKFYWKTLKESKWKLQMKNAITEIQNSTARFNNNQMLKKREYLQWKINHWKVN